MYSNLTDTVDFVSLFNYMTIRNMDQNHFLLQFHNFFKYFTISTQIVQIKLISTDFLT
jgi:hypothetical protein